MHAMYGQVLRHLGAIPQDRPLLVHCAAGTRSLIALSLLKRAGYDQAINLSGGFDAWKAAGLPVTLN
jgi:hydroxyacylglutathione hydrolase